MQISLFTQMYQRNRERKGEKQIENEGKNKQTTQKRKYICKYFCDCEQEEKKINKRRKTNFRYFYELKSMSGTRFA